MKTILDWDKSWLASWNKFVSSSHTWQILVKVTAEYLVYLVPIMLVVLWFWSKEAKKVALRAVLAGGLGLALAKIIGPIINRPRPFALGDIHELLFHRPDYSFPSDHAILFFALAFSFLFSKYKKLALFTFLLAVAMSASRIAAGIHYPSDIIFGALIGLVLAYLVSLFDRILDKLYNLIISLAKILRLA